MDVNSLSMSSYSAFLFTFNCSSSFLKLLSSLKRCIYNIFLICTCSIFNQFLYYFCLFPEGSLFPIELSPHGLVKTLVPSPYIDSCKGGIHLWSNTSVPPIISVSNPVFISGSVVREFWFYKLNICIRGRKKIVPKYFPTLVVNGKGLAVLGSHWESPSYSLIGLAYDLICISKGTDGGLGSSLTNLDPERYYCSCFR